MNRPPFAETPAGLRPIDAERDLTTKEDLARLWRRGPEK